MQEVEITNRPGTKEIVMLAGWQQWADAGAVSSGLPEYLVRLMNAQKIGSIRPDGFYLYQFPGTHDLVRPVIKFNQGYPVSLTSPENNFYYYEEGDRGVVIFRGDEPHLDIERYTNAFLEAAKELGVTRIIGMGGVYGEVPFDKDRTVSAIYSLRSMKKELARLAVAFSDYEGGASIESYICKRASQRKVPFMALYAFVPAYDFSEVSDIGNTIRLEDDYSAWLGVIQRVNFINKLNIPTSDLVDKANQLMEIVREKIDEIDNAAPQLGLKDYVQKISESFTEVQFNPLDDVWEEELKRLSDKFDSLDEP